MKHMFKQFGTKRAPLTFLITALAGITTVAFAADADAKPKKKKKKEEAKAVVAPDTVHYGKKANESWFKRLNEAFAEQSAMQCFTPPAPPKPGVKAVAAPSRRIGDPPFDSPPFPTGDWQIGGGPQVIGDPGALRDSPYPLMQAIYDGPNGKWWYDNRIQLYGWVTVSGNVSSSHNTSLSQLNNFPMVYSERGNRVENEQDVLYIERMADMNQTDHMDWGFRIALLYGLDYRFMGSRGFLNDTNLFRSNKFSGFDMPMMYFNVYFPHVLQGMELLIGRIISMPDIEQQLAPNNIMATHSLVYSFDNYTMWGLWAITKLNSRWTLQAGISTGVDTAPWAGRTLHEKGCVPTGSFNLQYIAPGGKDSFYIGMNSINSGNFGFNNLNECIESYSHKFNDKVWTTFEAQYMYTHHAQVTAAATTNNAGMVTVPFQDGFYPTKAGTVWTAGILNYTMFRLAPNTILTFRNEWWDDPYGYRSAYSSSYFESSIGLNWSPNKLLVIRPEIRFDRSLKRNSLASSTAAYNATGLPETVSGAYDNGTRQNQLSFVIDATFHF